MHLILRSFWSYFTEVHNEKSLNTASISIRARRRCLSVWEKWRDSRMRGKTLSAFFLFPFSLKWGERACELSARPPPAPAYLVMSVNEATVEKGARRSFSPFPFLPSHPLFFFLCPCRRSIRSVSPVIVTISSRRHLFVPSRLPPLPALISRHGYCSGYVDLR